MRGPVLSVLPLLACLGACPVLAAEASPDREATREGLRKQWYRCIRQEFSGQPVAVAKQAAQRAALAACKRQEDAYVAAEFALRQPETGAGGDAIGPVSRARAWISSVGSSVAATMVDPIASWFGGRP